MVKTLVLPNGVTCLCEERPDSGFVTMQVFFKKGSAHEAGDEQGLTNLMQEACFGGTATRSRIQISEDAESKGGAIGSETSRQATSFKSLSLTGNAEGTFAVMADVIRNPVFAPDEIARTKGQIAQGIIAADQEPQERAAKAFWETAYSGEAIGLDPQGTPELLASFTPAQIKKKHDELLSDPSGIIISFSGDIDAAKAEELSRKYFGDIPPAPPAPPLRATFTGGDVRDATDNDQLKLYLGFPAPDGKGEDRVTMLLLQDLLAGGMSTPIFQEIRAKRGLVYTAGAAYNPFPGDSTFFIVSGSGEGKAGEITKVTFDILGNVAREGFDEKAMEEARGRILRNIDGAREKAMSSGTMTASQVMERGRAASREEFEAKLKAVTNDDIRRVCIDMLKSGKYALSAVGPLATLPEPDAIRQMMKDAVDGIEAPQKQPVAPLAAAFAAAAAAPSVREEVAPKITTLENGMTIVTIERAGPMSCGAWVGVGSDNETPELNGATHMNEHMMFRGTPLYKMGEIQRTIEGDLGGQLNAYTTKDKTCYYFYNLGAAALDKVIEICGQMVFFANIAEKEYAGVPGFDAAGKPVTKGSERDAVLEEMRMCNDDVGHRMMDVMSTLAYPGQPNGRPILGTHDGLMAITSQQLRDYRDAFYAPNNVVFCAAGPIRHEDFVAAVEAKYGNLKPGSFANLPEGRWVGGTAFEEAESARLCNVMLAAPSVARTDPDGLAYDAVSTLLGDGDSSLLHREIVDRLQYSPAVECATMAYRNGGCFVMDALTSAQNVKPMMNAMYGTLRHLAENASEADLAKAKAILETSIRTGLETNRAATNAVACDVQAFGRIVTPDEIYADIRKLTVDDLKRVAEKLLAANPAASMIVPPGTDSSLLPTHGEVVAMRDGTYVPAAAVPQPKGNGVSPSVP